MPATPRPCAAGADAAAGRVAAQLAVRGSPYYSRARLVARAGIAAALGDQPGAFVLFRKAHVPGRLDNERGHGQWLFDRLRDYPPFLAYLRPQG